MQARETLFKKGKHAAVSLFGLEQGDLSTSHRTSGRVNGVIIYTADETEQHA